MLVKGSGHVQIAHDDPNWTGARQRISGGVEVPLGNGDIGFTVGTNLDSDAIQANAYYGGNVDDETTFRVGRKYLGSDAFRRESNSDRRAQHSR